MNGEIARGTSLMWFACVLAVISPSGAAQLIPCPDCGGDVSRRALMCPNCGLKGEMIAEPAKAGDAVVAPKQTGASRDSTGWPPGGRPLHSRGVSDASIMAE